MFEEGSDGLIDSCCHSRMLAPLMEDSKIHTNTKLILKLRFRQHIAAASVMTINILLTRQLT